MSTDLIGKPVQGYKSVPTLILTRSVDGRAWVVGRDFESHVHHEKCFLKESDFPRVENLKKYFWIPKKWNRVFVARRPVYPVRSRGGESVVRLRLGKRLVNL